MARLVRIASVQLPAVVADLPPHERKHANITEAIRLIESCVSGTCDLVVLPETFNVWHVRPESYRELADPLPQNLDPLDAEATTLVAVSALARRLNTYIVAPVLTRSGERLRNSSILLDRRGEIAGIYDKVHVTTPEYEWGITPGSDFPVFDCDFGRVGMMICFDLSFPEAARCLALNGAEIVAFSTMQSYYGEISWDVTLRSRAIDNAIWIAVSNYGYAAEQPWMPDMIVGHSGVVAPDGHTVCDLGRLVGVAQATIDLDQPRMVRSFGVAGQSNYRLEMQRHRRPDTYGAIVDGRLQRNPLVK